MTAAVPQKTSTKSKIHCFIESTHDQAAGRSAYAAILEHRASGTRKAIAGNSEVQTADWIELHALVVALNNLSLPSTVTVICRKAVADGFNNWLSGWVQRNWVSTRGRPIDNADLWAEIVTLADKHDLTLVPSDQYDPTNDPHPNNREQAHEFANTVLTKDQSPPNGWQRTL